MVNQGIAQKESRKYSLRLEWVRQLRHFAEEAEEALVRRSALDLITSCDLNGGVYTRTFSCAAELDPHIQEIIINRKGETIISETPHLWWALLYSREMLEKQSFRAAHENIYTICHGDTPVDLWCARVEKELGIHTKVGVPGAPYSQIVVVSDYVVQYYYPTEIHEAMHSLYSAVHTFTPLVRDRISLALHKLFAQRAEVSVVVTKNPTAANRIRSNVLNVFKK